MHLSFRSPSTIKLALLSNSTGTDAHEFHHSVNKGCFASKLSIWDMVFGTDKAYKEWRKKRWGIVD
jgi:sterol desaturase/sphingolipid hydroxylase (fatty acid hydroxylase superfamily)